MRNGGLISAGLLLAAIAAGAEQSDDRFTLHQVVAIKSIECLPADIAPLFRRHREQFQRHAAAPGVAWVRDRTLRRCNRWHQVAADVEAQEQNRDARIVACRAFPRDKLLAEKLYQQRRFRKGGTLPWAIEECYERLVDAFESGDAEEVVARAGHLAHFVADAMNPFRVSANYDGTATGNITIGSARGIHPRSDRRTIRERFGVGLMARHADDYAQALQISTADYQPVWEVLPRTFEFIEDSLAVMDQITRADREITAKLEIVDRETFRANERIYFAAMEEACRDICIDRLGAAAVLTANLIGGAWQTAGEPFVETIRVRDVVETEPGPPAAPSAPAAFVGSRHSNVFHRPNCKFAQQISDDNLVTFESAVEARREGRRACRVCKPE
jgi:hypothetical protein